jgi:hypothetical protein
VFERATPRPFHRNIEKESNVVGSRSLATSGSSNFEEAILKRTETQAIDYSLDGSAGPSHEIEGETSGTESPHRRAIRA